LFEIASITAVEPSGWESP